MQYYFEFLVINSYLQFHSIPWIPVEYHNVDVNHVEALIKNDPKAEIWAYATTLWEIFSRGIEMPDLDSSFFTHGRRLEPPKELDNLREIYKIMREGWETEPDRRFTTQDIFSRLIDARKLSHPHDIFHYKIFFFNTIHFSIER